MMIPGRRRSNRKNRAKLAQPGAEGMRAATVPRRDLGVPEQTVRRAAQVDSITPAAKEAVREAGLDRNQSALLRVASYADEDQVEAVKEIVREKSEKALARVTELRPGDRIRSATWRTSAREIWLAGIKETTPNDAST